MDQPLMSVRNIETWYGPINAIRGVSLDINEGRVVAVLGANGAGKTTLLRTIAGVIDPFKGSVTFEPAITARSGRGRATWRRWCRRVAGVPVPSARQPADGRGGVATNPAVKRPGAHGCGRRASAGPTPASFSGGEQQMLAIGGRDVTSACCSGRTFARALPAADKGYFPDH
jgi:predicted ABC-type transport system involved in lysophospholipase L1 biosynthesis ATPase subunit